MILTHLRASRKRWMSPNFSAGLATYGLAGT
jgi:hypothetical protein